MAKLNGWGKAYAVFLLCAATSIVLPAQTFTTLVNFDGPDGAYPDAGLVQAANGDFYGTTAGGGANDEGTIFKITPAGGLTTLDSFDGSDGDGPVADLVQATDGDFYGTTAQGGANGYGTVYKTTSTGQLTTLYSFCSQANCADGSYPWAGLIQAANGNFYGTTSESGANDQGTVFEITPAGKLTRLHSFDGTDGSSPYAGLIQATDGDFYGTTYGGADNEGTVFKITSGGTVTTLHIFLGINGAYPRAGLIRSTDGDFYGTTFSGGTNGDGTVFKITPAGTLTKLHTFDGADGSYPYAGLIQATDGDLYGTTASGGADNEGTVFSLSVGLGPFVATRPTSGDVGASVIILGTNLTGSTSVTFNGTAATFNVVSGSEIATTVPAGATSGTVEVTTSSRTLKSNVSFRVLP
ncbi:MAG: choice-of-anchor tandem repeat GloVer-containing protein [Candidatus Sulfotelmatobacter sp.]